MMFIFFFPPRKISQISVGSAFMQRVDMHSVRKLECIKACHMLWVVMGTFQCFTRVLYSGLSYHGITGPAWAAAPREISIS